MSVCGIIAEYNPFHNGHRYQIRQARAVTGAEDIVAVMSGNFVQRGEPAICDKYSRTKMALLNGADLVLELPVYFATASAEFFAGAAVALLHCSGIADTLCFGSESGDLKRLSAIAESLARTRESDAFKALLKEELKKGLSFPAARQNALYAAENGRDDSLSEPNDILGVEYLKALDAIGSAIQPFAVRRERTGYHSRELPPDPSPQDIASATAIRALILNEPDACARHTALSSVMPETSLRLLADEINKKNAPHTLDHFSQIFQFVLATSARQQLKEILDMNEGLQNRILRIAGAHPSISEITAHVKTKRYAYTKLQRAILHTILNIRQADFERFLASGGPQYIRVLGFRKEKSRLLAQMKEKSQLPVVLNLKYAQKELPPDAMEMLAHEIMTTDIYYLALNRPKKTGYEYTAPLCII